MAEYKILTKRIFESVANFEKRMNGLALEGWRAKSIARESARLVVLLEREARDKFH